MSGSLARFLSGWRYVTTQEEADALPIETVALEDEDSLWDTFDPVIVAAQRFFILLDDSTGEHRKPWIETNDDVERQALSLPFFAWHPSFCDGDVLAAAKAKRETL